MNAGGATGIRPLTMAFATTAPPRTPRTLGPGSSCALPARLGQWRCRRRHRRVRRAGGARPTEGHGAAHVREKTRRRAPVTCGCSPDEAADKDARSHDVVEQLNVRTGVRRRFARRRREPRRAAAPAPPPAARAVTSWAELADGARDGSRAGPSPLPPSRRQQRRAVRAILADVILPTDYPHSVSPDYGEFYRWNILRHLLLEAAEVLGTQSMLFALGLGAKDLPVAASVKWVLKDGLGYLSKVALATRLAPLVDQEPKRFRVLGDVVMSLGTALEIVTTLFPTYFLLFASLGNVLRSGADVATGPAYRVFLTSFAVRSNIGDVSAKAESQVVLGRVLGIASGIGASTIVKQDTSAALLVFSALGAGHIYATWRSVADLQLRTLNRARTEYALDAYVRSGGERVASVAEANRAERVLYVRYRARWPRIQFARDVLRDVLQRDARDGDVDWARFAQCNYVLVQRQRQQGDNDDGDDNDNDGAVIIALRETAGVRDILQALLHARLGALRVPTPPPVDDLLAKLAEQQWDLTRVLWPTFDVRLARTPSSSLSSTTTTACAMPTAADGAHHRRHHHHHHRHNSNNYNNKH